MRDTRVILIGGPSHVGKSTLALAMADELGWQHISTDSLARHPGRPWKSATRPVRQHVADHYLSLSVDELITDVLRHYKSMWPGIEELVRGRATDPTADRLIIEGSAIWPERVAATNIDCVAAFWLTAGNELLTDRIHAASRFEKGTPEEKALIEKFLGRNYRLNELMMDAVNKIGLASIDVSSAPTTSQLMAQCLELIA
ncbi:MAG: hypothetical protein IH868_05630 [Chloroflexi bacterium]|nr:hypothetical protein [Chloroflexota bacterium]